MSQMQIWFSAGELASMGLPGIPCSKQGVNMKADREGWSDPQFEHTRWRKREARGGGKEYHLFCLPPGAVAMLRDDHAVRQVAERFCVTQKAVMRQAAARGIAALLEMQALGEVPVSFAGAGA